MSIILAMFDGLPTSMARAMVTSALRGFSPPVLRYSTNTSLELLAARKRLTGNPIIFDINPAARVPRLPHGTEITIFAFRPAALTAHEYAWKKYIIAGSSRARLMEFPDVKLRAAPDAALRSTSLTSVWQSSNDPATSMALT